ncbi:hypothetical protein [Trinickia mobilis]|uniref:hypothetical protein n=1 Tax=Trinickia mobilis TaxID=2816356 RepID=UPI001A8F19A1|nr:hypothetical protein [Trinickia mobilis]
MPFVKLPSGSTSLAPKGYTYVATEAIVRVTPRVDDPSSRITLSTPVGSPKSADAFSTAPLASLLEILGPHIKVELRYPHQTHERTSYVRLNCIAYVLPTDIAGGVLRVLLTNGEEIPVASEGPIMAHLDGARSL